MSDIKALITAALKEESPSALEKHAEKLNVEIDANIGSSEIDLRSASLRDFFVELLWRSKIENLSVQNTEIIVTNGINLLKILVESKTITPIVQKMIELFSPGGVLEPFSTFTEFFSKTLVQHQKLWKAVLTTDRETSLISREINISSLEDEFCSMSLNMALPEEYLRPPVEETSETNSDCSGLLQIPCCRILLTTVGFRQADKTGKTYAFF